MCGRFTLTCSFETIQASFGLANSLALKPRYNIAPSQLIPVIRKPQHIDLLKWGFVPSWASDDLKKSGWINARLETVSEKPSFKKAYAQRRCGIVCDGYFEWRQIKKTKQPYYIFLEKHRPFILAGIWEAHLNASHETIETCAILTMPAIASLEKLHERMPVILDYPELIQWLAGHTFSQQSLSSKKLSFFPVPTRMNDPQYDAPGCIYKL